MPEEEQPGFSRRSQQERRLDSIRGSLNEAAADPVRYTGAEIRNYFDRLLVDAESKLEQ